MVQRLILPQVTAEQLSNASQWLQDVASQLATDRGLERSDPKFPKFYIEPSMLVDEPAAGPSCSSWS